MTRLKILTATLTCSLRTGTTVVAGSTRIGLALTTGGLTAMRSRSSFPQVELGIGFYALALESFTLGFARMCGANFLLLKYRWY